MNLEEIEIILRQIQALRPRKETSRDERVRLLLQRKKLRRQFDECTFEGQSTEALILEANTLYDRTVSSDRNKESALAVRDRMLWAEINKRKRPPR